MFVFKICSRPVLETESVPLGSFSLSYCRLFVSPERLCLSCCELLTGYPVIIRVFVHAFAVNGVFPIANLSDFYAHIFEN